MPRKAPPRIVQFHTRQNKPGLVEVLLTVPPQERAQFRAAAQAVIAMNFNAFVSEYWTKNGLEGAPPPLTILQGQVDAKVRQGRWVVECPECPSAMLVDAEFPFFICIECGSDVNGGQWFNVVFPPNQVALERTLLVRPVMDSRNWEIGETLADLKQQNIAHGLPEE